MSLTALTATFRPNHFTRLYNILGAHQLWDLFWTSGDVCPGFHSQVKSLAYVLSRLRAMLMFSYFFVIQKT